MTPAGTGYRSGCKYYDKYKKMTKEASKYYRNAQQCRSCTRNNLIKNVPCGTFEYFKIKTNKYHVWVHWMPMINILYCKFSFRNLFFNLYKLFRHFWNNYFFYHEIVFITGEKRVSVWQPMQYVMMCRCIYYSQVNMHSDIANK